MGVILTRLLLLLALLVSPQSMLAAQLADDQLTSQPHAIPLLRFEGAIGPATSEYLVNEIQSANRLQEHQRPPLIVITLDTPGGLVSSLRAINQQILASHIPIACLVSPSGARAMSAGTYILYACHIAAMAPATTLGAATPVQMGTPPQSPNNPAPDGSDKSKESTDKYTHPSDNRSAIERKVLNDAIAYIRSLAELRNRNTEFAENAVLEAATMTADEALKANVINLIAIDAKQMIRQLNGTEVVIADQPRTLMLDSATLVEHPRSWRNHFIATITDPNIAYILMLIGIYGLLLEFYSPGVGIAGVVGGISLLIALYALQLLPINYAGLGLMLLGIALLVAESMVPSFGILGLGGAIAFALGSLFLLDTEVDHFSISLPLIAAVTVTALLFSFWVLTSLWKQRHRQVVSGDQAIIGAEAVAIQGFDNNGFVLLDGECWAATSEKTIETNQRVIVIARERLTLKVKPITHQPEVMNHGSHPL